MSRFHHWQEPQPSSFSQPPSALVADDSRSGQVNGGVHTSRGVVQCVAETEAHTDSLGPPSPVLPTILSGSLAFNCSLTQPPRTLLPSPSSSLLPSAVSLSPSFAFSSLTMLLCIWRTVAANCQGVRSPNRGGEIRPPRGRQTNGCTRFPLPAHWTPPHVPEP